MGRDTDMDSILILGDGPLGRSVEAAAHDAGHPVSVFGRPAGPQHRAADLTPAAIVVEASRADSVVANLDAALRAGCRRFVIATTGWGAERAALEARLTEDRAAAVAASNFSIGVVLFGRLVEEAATLFGPLVAFDPFLLEWHRRGKRDRPSGTAGDLARRIVAGHPRLAGTDELEIVSVRAGASPGMHLVGFDAPGETVELRLTARDRSAYAAGILAAADWLGRTPRPAGIHPFEPIVDELVARRPIAA
jgi:4-hydroxy-tetrahydrodipicolinate reductase